jgi:hypothetical protein
MGGCEKLILDTWPSILDTWLSASLGLDTRSIFSREYTGYFGLDTRHTGLDTRVEFGVRIETVEYPDIFVFPRDDN